MKNFIQTDWINFFPLASPRFEQVNAINFALNTLYKDNNDYCIMECGTGVGKSAIAVTLARWVHENIGDGDNASYVLTSQKVLQDQYATEFSQYAVDLRSSANFTCTGMPAQTCAETLRLRRAFQGLADVMKWVPCKECEATVGCPYAVAKQRFKDSILGITNYSYLLSETVYAGGLKPREMLILDEAHNIESEVRRWGSIELPEMFAKHELKIDFPKDISDDNTLILWIAETYVPALDVLTAKTLQKLRSAFKRKRFDVIGKISQTYTFLDKHKCQLNRYFEELGGPMNDYVIVKDGVAGKRNVTLKPLDVTMQARLLLYTMGRKRVLMSATILDEHTFMRSAGVPSDMSASISIPSPFPPSAFGITFDPIGKMSKAQAKLTEHDLLKKVKSILDKHPNVKGIIHTANYDTAKMIGKIDNKRLLVQATADDREKLLHEHLTSPEPTLIVSPSMMEGLDLKDDLGRLQIICKVPFPYIGDPVVEIKMQRDPQWYAWCTARAIVQSIGRSVRNNTDWTSTYILDECFRSFYKRWSKLFPPNFSEMKML
jgi:Rad3-related DNA helicase